MFDDFSGMFEVHTGNEWKKVVVKAGAGLAAVVCGRSFEKRTYCAEIVRFMYAEREGGDGLTFLLLLFTGGCAFWDLKKRRIPNGMLLLGGLLFLLIRFGLGMKMGYTAGWDGGCRDMGRRL